MKTLVVAFPTLPEVLDQARTKYRVITGPDPARALSPSEIVSLAQEQEADAIMISPFHKMTASMIAALPPQVKVIATSSVGFEHIDREAVRQKGLIATNTPDVLTDCTADLGILLMMAACRRLPEYGKIMQRGWGTFFGQNQNLGVRVSGKTLGIYGMGRIGRALADRARGFGMKILYCNRNRLAPDLEKGAIYFQHLEEMLPHCRILSLNAPATPDNRHVMNAKTFALLPPGAVFVNVARGSLVDEAALLDALRSGQLFGAGLDVFDNEPNFNRLFLDLPNVALSPHMGSATVETRTAMGLLALENIDAVLEGKPAPHPIL